MSDVVIKVTGLEEIMERLNALEDNKLARAMMRTGSREAAKVLLEGQKETVPFETGKLEDSLGIQTKNAKSDNLQILIGPDKKLNFIGRFHEFGTKFMPGSHWMQKAWDETSKDALEVYIEKVRKLLDKRLWKDLMSAIEVSLNSADEEK